ncbi:MAG: hypothetical protein LBI43_06725 [Streptococcaceae bacterium]|jgi:hypothetical protein|nr:hypothetical protein [Streptococcaceae bacterium]
MRLTQLTNTFLVAGLAFAVGYIVRKGNPKPRESQKTGFELKPNNLHKIADIQGYFAAHHLPYSEDESKKTLLARLEELE